MNTISKDRMLLDISSSFLYHCNLQFLLSSYIGIHAYLCNRKYKTHTFFGNNSPSNPSYPYRSSYNIPFPLKTCSHRWVSDLCIFHLNKYENHNSIHDFNCSIIEIFQIPTTFVHSLNKFDIRSKEDFA